MKIAIRKEGSNIVTTTLPAGLQTANLESQLAWANSNLGAGCKIVNDTDLPPESQRTLWSWTGNAADDVIVDLAKYKATKIAQLKKNRDASFLNPILGHSALEMVKKSVSEHASSANFPATGNADLLYLAQDSSENYYWDGSQYRVVDSNALDQNDMVNNYAYKTINDPINFVFSLTPTGISQTEPAAIIANLESKSAGGFTRYLCAVPSGDSFRKAYVKLTKEISKSVQNHIESRTITNIEYAKDVEDLINAATTQAEIDAIDITF